jgi:hypothetical protein
MFAAMNLLAFAFHTVCDSLEQLWIQTRTAKGSRLRFFQDVRTLTAYILFPSWSSFMNIVARHLNPGICSGGLFCST